LFESYLTNRKQRVVIGGKYIHGGVPQGSILGPFLFLLYVADISKTLENQASLFADDTTIIRPITDNPTANIQSLNDDLTRLMLWADLWRVTFNPAKTYFLRISNKQNRPLLRPILFNNTIVQEVETHTNLGLTFNNKFTWDDHITRICNKASQRLTLITKFRYILPRHTLERTYLTMIRPILEYADIIYDNTTFENKQKLEHIQRRAGITCTGAYRHTEHQTLLLELCWETLSLRRKNHKLIQYYKIKNGKTPQYLSKELPPVISSLTTYSLRNRNQLREQYTRLSSSYNSYFPSTTRLWNKVPLMIRMLPTLTSFKHNIQKKTKQPLFHSLCGGRKGAWITRLRLGLSALNAHRFKYNFIHSPNCDKCQTHSESTKHYFLDCPAYSIARLVLLGRLRDELELDITNRKQLLKYFLHRTKYFLKNIILKQFLLEFMVTTGRFAKV
jgi:ribonuclease P/MRP protein subunit RPP40